MDNSTVGLIVGPAVIAALINIYTLVKVTNLKGDIDAHQSLINNSYDKQIANLQSNLKILENRVISLHTQRLEVIKRLYELLLNLHTAMYNYITGGIVREGEDYIEFLKDRQTKLNSTFNEYSIYLNYNNLYLTKALTSKLENLGKEYSEAVNDFQEGRAMHSYKDVPAMVLKRADEAMKSAIIKIQREIPETLEEIQTEFRITLGVEEPAQT